MSNIDQVWDELDAIFVKWGIREIPFSESAAKLNQAQLNEVFTGRHEELKTVLPLFKGIVHKRVLVYGWIGIGKTAFMLEVINVLERKAKDTLATYISLPPEMDLATAAFIALARKMEDDEWAQKQLNQMGLRPRKEIRERTSELKGGVPVIGASITEQTIPVNPPQFPTQSFQELFERALTQYKKVVVAIDDLDKQDPARIRQLLHNAQGMLKGGAWFLLSGQPSGLTRDLLTIERGLFDLALELKPLDQPTTYKMLVNYLNSVRAEDQKCSPDDPKAVFPFTPETAKMLCERSEGNPRYLNRYGMYVLVKAAQLEAEIITPDVLQQGFVYVDKQLRGQPGLTLEDSYVLDMVLEKRVLSDETMTLEDLERMKVKEFSEILPILERLVQKDLIRRLPSERAAEYSPTPMLTGQTETPEQE